MANKLYEENSVKAIADAIREKTGGTATYKVGDMAMGGDGVADKRSDSTRRHTRLRKGGGTGSGKKGSGGANIRQRYVYRHVGRPPAG